MSQRFRALNSHTSIETASAFEKKNLAFFKIETQNVQKQTSLPSLPDRSIFSPNSVVILQVPQHIIFIGT